ncbi:hypothetical protein [Duganella sp. HH105]|uniref:hypothetical protein n=1 Tax=Duganella sp. HH105 TaxID=1781067 RepID=UPI000892EFCB|nr:hypothetical protein [Duganella sp. HH105]OEZ55668.1 hypothetical protein DUGA6_53220 [Duganella sp. HH105]
MKKQTQTKKIHKPSSRLTAIVKPVAAVAVPEQQVLRDIRAATSVDDGLIELPAPVAETAVAPITDVFAVFDHANGDAQQARSSTLILPRPLDVKVTIAHIEKLRDQAAAADQKFTIPGRNAVRAMMSEVYARYHEIMSSASSREIIDLLKSGLEAQEIKFRSSSRDASVLIRYVFREFSDKQVHIYSVALEEAFRNQVMPQDFAKFIGSRGGFEKAAAGKVEPKAGKFDRWDAGLDVARGADKLGTVAVAEWDEDEPCRIFVAMPNGEEAADIKDTKMTVERCKAVLAIYLADYKERNSPKAKQRKLTDDEKFARRQLKGEVSYAEQMVEEYEINLKVATRDSNGLEIEKSNRLLLVAKLKLKAAKMALKGVSKL